MRRPRDKLGSWSSVKAEEGRKKVGRRVASQNIATPSISLHLPSLPFARFASFDGAHSPFVQLTLFLTLRCYAQPPSAPGARIRTTPPLCLIRTHLSHLASWARCASPQRIRCNSQRSVASRSTPSRHAESLVMLSLAFRTVRIRRATSTASTCRFARLAAAAALVTRQEAQSFITKLTHAAATRSCGMRQERQGSPRVRAQAAALWPCPPLRMTVSRLQAARASVLLRRAEVRTSHLLGEGGQSGACRPGSRRHGRKEGQPLSRWVAR